MPSYNWVFWIKILFYVLIALAVILSRRSISFKMGIRERKKIDILYWALFIGLLNSLFLAGQFYGQVFGLAIGIGALFGLLMTTVKQKLALELFHLILIISIVFLHFQPWFKV